jgi:hypothetical protein
MTVCPLLNLQAFNDFGIAGVRLATSLEDKRAYSLSQLFSGSAFLVFGKG